MHLSVYLLVTYTGLVSSNTLFVVFFTLNRFLSLHPAIRTFFCDCCLQLNVAGSMLVLARLYIRDGVKFILWHGRKVSSRIAKPIDFFGGLCSTAVIILLKARNHVYFISGMF